MTNYRARRVLKWPMPFNTRPSAAGLYHAFGISTGAKIRVTTELEDALRMSARAAAVGLRSGAGRGAADFGDLLIRFV